MNFFKEAVFFTSVSPVELYICQNFGLIILVEQNRIPSSFRTHGLNVQAFVDQCSNNRIQIQGVFIGIYIIKSTQVSNSP
jgi:hypothetical protein